MRLGAHISIAGGWNKVVERAVERGCETIQIFTRNPRGWAIPKPIDKKEAEEFQRALQKENIYPLVVHLPYLPNIASPDDLIYEKSINLLISDLERASILGAPYVVVHTGNYGNKDEEWGKKRVIFALKTTLSQVKGKVMILLENQGGAGSELGYSWEQLSSIIEALPNNFKKRVGICFDICHAFIAGYDLRDKKSQEDTLNKFDSLIGLDKLKVVHASDTKSPLGSKLDRHAHIGEGEIKEKGFSLLINHPKLKDIPLILETPVMSVEDDIRNLNVLRKLRKE